MIICGIDPGIAILGWGMIRVQKDTIHPMLIGYGTIETASNLPTWRRLEGLSRDLSSLIRRYRPDYVAIERPQLHGTTNAWQISWATGAIITSLGRCGYEDLDWYAPNTIKKQVTGSGNAKKPQVRSCVAGLLGLNNIKGIDDSIDAVAIALTSWKSKVKKSV